MKAELVKRGIKLSEVLFCFFSITNKKGQEEIIKTFIPPEKKKFSDSTDLYFDVIIRFNKVIPVKKIEKFLKSKLYLPMNSKNTLTEFCLGGEIYGSYTFIPLVERQREKEYKKSIYIAINCYRGKGNYQSQQQAFGSRYKHILKYQKTLKEQVKEVLA